MQEEQLREMLSVDVLISGKVNLTKNQVEELWGHRSFPAAFQKVQDCGGLFQLMGSIWPTPRSASGTGRSSAGRPAGQVPGGGPGNLGDYRCVNFDGEILWAALRATIHEDPETGDILLFGYVRDIDSRKKDGAGPAGAGGKGRGDGPVQQGHHSDHDPAHSPGAPRQRRPVRPRWSSTWTTLSRSTTATAIFRGTSSFRRSATFSTPPFQQKGLVGRIGGMSSSCFWGDPQRTVGPGADGRPVPDAEHRL